MMLTTKGRYAVMAMVDIAANSNGKPVRLAEIEARQEISIAYLEQLFAKLRRAGLVNSVRGPGGGYLLGRPASAIHMNEIVQAVDEPIKMTRCGSHNKPAGCIGGTRCLTHDLWEGLGQQIHNYLQAITLSDVCDKKVKFSALTENLAVAM